jgi:TRAP-type C4-dicarboxylate transport system substrate-binding protein
MYEGVVSGAADIGIAAFGYTRGRHPLLQVFELPGIYFGSAAASSMLARDVVKKFKPAELSDVKVIYLYGVGPGHLYSTKLVRTLEDLKGLRVRSVGFTTKAFRALDAVPVSMTQSGVYDALSKGIVDGTVAPPEVLKGYRQAEVTKYIIVTPPLMMGLHFCVMNLEKWNSLPSDVQKVFDDVNDKFVLKAGKIWDYHQIEGMDYGIQHGMEVIEIPPDEAKRWTARLKPVQDEYVAEMAAKGLPGKEVLDFVLENAREYAERYGAPIYEYKKPER